MTNDHQATDDHSAADEPGHGGPEAGAWGDSHLRDRVHEAEERLEERFERLEAAAIEAELETGRREETIEQAKRNVVLRVARVSLGLVVTLLGIVMLALPGPGMLAVVAGLAIMSRDVPFAHRLMLQLRERLPQDEQGKLPRSTIITMVVMAVVFTGGSLWFTLGR